MKARECVLPHHPEQEKSSSMPIEILLQERRHDLHSMDHPLPDPSSTPAKKSRSHSAVLAPAEQTLSEKIPSGSDSSVEMLELHGLEKSPPPPHDLVHLDTTPITIKDLAVSAKPKSSPHPKERDERRPSKSPKNEHSSSSVTHALRSSSALLLPEQLRLSRVRFAVQTLLAHRFSLHEYTVPRLFIVLPESITEGFVQQSQDPLPWWDPSLCRFRLFFLCECSSSFTLPLGSGLNHLHIGKHEGYSVELGRQEEFFKRYGKMILTLLIFLKHGQGSSSGYSSTSPPTTSKNPQQDHDHLPKKVAKLSSLKKSDLPESIAQDVESKVTKMIQYLETIVSLDSNPKQNVQDSHSTLAKPTVGFGSLSVIHGDEGACACDQADKGEDLLVLQGLSSLADLHQLYSFLGIADVVTRLQTGQLGNMFRVSNVRGQVSWVCMYHYRWTFLEKNIDDFERWIVSRGGLFDKQSGSLSIMLVSRAHARTFCSWIANKVAPSLVEVHLRLGWKFGKKDLWRLARSLANSTVTVLSIDGCSHTEDSTYLNFHKKYDPLWHLMTHGQLHSLELSYFPSFFTRLSQRSAKALTLKRLEFGPGMMLDSADRGSLSAMLASCSLLEELILPGFPVSGLHIQSILTGIRACHSLETLDLSNSYLDDGAAIILAQGLFQTKICHIDLSGNDQLSDTGAARVIRAIGPRLTSLKMAQTGFGDMAAVALVRSMEGISITSTLQDQLLLQHRLNIATITAGHRAGMRFSFSGGLPQYPAGPEPTTGESGTTLRGPISTEERTKTHTVGQLVYLDIEDNHCTGQGFRALANVKARLYLMYLNLSGSEALSDDMCARFLAKMASSGTTTLRLAHTGFGHLSAKSLANVLMVDPPHRDPSRIYERCLLSELDIQGCPIGSDGFQVLLGALERAGSASCLKVLDIGHCEALDDRLVQNILRTMVIPNGTEMPQPFSSAFGRHTRLESGTKSLTNMTTLQESAMANLDNSPGREVDGDDSASFSRAVFRGRGLAGRSGSVPVFAAAQQDDSPIPQRFTPYSGGGLTSESPIPADRPPLELLPLADGFFTNLRHLDIKSTGAGDATAWLLSQALTQPWVMLESLTILEPSGMSMQGICWILEAMGENSTISQFGIGRSDMSARDLERFGVALVALMEMNKRVRSLTTIGAPLGAMARGLLLDLSLHSLYLIRSKGQPEDLQVMGQALGFNRTLLVYWMGGSDDSLLGQQFPVATHDDPSGPNRERVIGASSSFPPSSTLDQQQRQRENMYRNFHLLHQQEQEEGQSFYKSVPHKFTTAMKAALHLGPARNRSPEGQNHHHRHRPHSRSRQRGGGGGGQLEEDIYQDQMVLEDPRRSGRRSSARSNAGAKPRFSPTGQSAGMGGGTVGFNPWTRHPIMEGIRRNHSLIKIHLDLYPAASNLAVPALMMNLSQMDHSYQHEQIRVLQRQSLAKKEMMNRRALRERSRVGREELKLLGLDDDVIREVCLVP